MFFRKKPQEEKTNKNNKNQENDPVMDYKKVKTNRFFTDDGKQTKTTVQTSTTTFGDQSMFGDNDGFDKIISNLKTQLLNQQGTNGQTKEVTRHWVNGVEQMPGDDNNISRDTQSYLENQNTKVLLADDLNSMMQQFTNVAEKAQSILNENKSNTKPTDRAQEEFEIKTKNLIQEQANILINNIKNIDLNDPNVRVTRTSSTKTYNSGFPNDIDFDSFFGNDEPKEDLRIRKNNKREV